MAHRGYKVIGNYNIYQVFEIREANPDNEYIIHCL